MKEYVEAAEDLLARASIERLARKTGDAETEEKAAALLNEEL